MVNAASTGLIIRHALGNALIPVLTVIGLGLGNLLGGKMCIRDSPYTVVLDAEGKVTHISTGALDADTMYERYKEADVYKRQLPLYSV